MGLRGPVEIAAAVAVVGSALASFAPTFLRELQAARISEAVDGVQRIGASAVSYSQGRELAASFPPSVPLTPAQVPRGVAVVDAPGTWDSETWKALAFRFDTPHRFSFAFEVTPEPSQMWFSVIAQGDLNGDGVLSTFKMTGHRKPGQDAELVPGLAVDREVE